MGGGANKHLVESLRSVIKKIIKEEMDMSGNAPFNHTLKEPYYLSDFKDGKISYYVTVYDKKTGNYRTTLTFRANNDMQAQNLFSRSEDKKNLINKFGDFLFSISDKQ
jgi:hypothetical protein